MSVGKSKRMIWLAIAGIAWCLLAAAARAEPAAQAAYQQSVDKAIEFLRSKAQAPDGSFFAKGGPGVTAMVAYSVMRHGRSPDDPMVAKALKHVEKYMQPDGSICDKDGFYQNYETCLAIMCLSEANADHRYDKQIKAAEKFIRDAQWDDGGAGYGKHKRADLSNTSFFIEALKSAGKGPEDPAIQKALAFVSKCQNLEGPNNPTEYAAKVNDGGFYYSPQAGGVSMAEKTPNGGLRSYGSMTYAGLKSMLYAGVKADDPRVKAALQWIRKSFDVKANPGMGKQGLFYYYHVFSKALDVAGLDAIEDSQGVKHDWRRELREELIARQQPDGSWVNTETRWLEGEPTLATAYALMSLAYCKPAR